MNVLIVSSAPATRCGIARYAVQQAAKLREAGHLVDWASSDGGTEGVRYPLNLRERKDFARLPLIARRYDKVIFHYQHDLYYRGLDNSDLSFKNMVLAALFATHPDVEVVVHEMLYHLMDPKQVGRRVWTTERLKWRLAKKLVFHTDTERTRFLQQMPEAAARLELREHHSEMVKYRELSQPDARQELGLPRTGPVFLCIGFIQESKGFDRAVRAFARVNNPDARLYVVGSIRVEEPQHRRYLEMLQAMAAKDPRVQVLERFVDDAAFDTWLAASDVVVLPYRNIYSSGVAARARLYGKRLLVADVGGLRDQLAPGDVVFESEVELAQALVTLSGGAKAALVRQHRSGEGLRLAFVLPWYGRDIPGGAESQARRTILKLAEAGVRVEVLTTTIQDYFHDWSVNARKAGVEQVDGITVRRFPVLQRDAKAFNAVNVKVKQHERLSDSDRRIFEEEMIKCPRLPEWIAAHRADHDFFVFIPYMFATTVKGSQACPGQAVHIPCLHDEGYLDLDWYARMLKSARGILFNSPPERDLAVRRFGITAEQSALTGEGLETDWFGDGERFRREQGLDEYLLFIGRKEIDKNFPLLVEYFRRYRDERCPELTLVVFGPGGRQADAIDGRSILDLGFAPDAMKRDALAGSLALVQPSVLESFSLTVMESWIAERPVLVHKDCEVTRDHAVRSGGALWFKSYYEFAACVDRLRSDKALAEKLGAAGRHYVLSNYSWPHVIDQYLAAFEGWRRPGLRRSA